MILDMLVFGLAALASAPTMTGGAAAPPDVVVDGTRIGSDDEKICEKVILPGTRLVTKRVCETRAQWMARRQGDREVLEDMLRRSLQSGGRKP